MSQQSNPILWFEINTKSADTAVDFYNKVFGYQIQDWQGPNAANMPPYKMLVHGGAPFGGAMSMEGPQAEHIPPHWMIYFHSSDVAKSVETTKANGGELVWGPETVPGVGTMATVTDSVGAHFSFLQPEDPTQEMPEGPPAIDWIENMSPSREKANAFYSQAMGWEVDTQNMGPEVGDYSMYHIGETFFAGAMDVPDPNIPPNWTVYLVTKNIQETCDKINANGGKVVTDIMAIPGVGHIAMAIDNQGAAFGLHQPENN